MEPWPCQRTDFNAALVAATIAGALGGGGGNPPGPGDFIPDYWATRAPLAEQSQEEQLNKMRDFAAMIPGIERVES